jgi:hypothetical protein
VASTLSGHARTLELRQLSEISQRLEAGMQIVAEQLGVQPATARLDRLHWTGPAEFPYIYGDFRIPQRAGTTTVPLHSSALRELSHLLGLHHVWGV